MKTYGVIYPNGTKELISIVLDDAGEPRLDTLAPYPTPEDWVEPTIIPLVKLHKPAEGRWQETLVWHDDRVERQWLPADPTPAPPAPSLTAEAHLTASGYTPLRLLTCLDLEGKLWKANATSPKLAAVRQWLDNLTLAAAANPDEARPDWPAAPFAFEAVLAEALSILTAP